MSSCYGALFVNCIDYFYVADKHSLTVNGRAVFAWSGGRTEVQPVCQKSDSWLGSVVLCG
jgi:hypothetical protein